MSESSLRSDRGQSGADAGAGASGPDAGKRAPTSRYVQRKADDAAPTDRAGDWERPAGAGAPLDDATRTRAESSLGVGLGDVRVHTGGEATASAASVSARAYTTGSDIYFGAGQYQPGTAGGDHLVAHELVHVAQQASAPAAAQAKADDGISQTHDPAEREADRGADAILSGESFRAVEAPAPIAREALGGNPANVPNGAQNAANGTVHQAPTVGNAANHAGPGAAPTAAHPANVKVIASESAMLHIQPATSCPDGNLVYQEGAAVSPTPSGFTAVEQMHGTMTAPMIDETADNSLFINGRPSPDDIQQGQIGDCYWESTMMSVAGRDPGQITSMMSPNGTGGATVKLWRKQQHNKSVWESIFGGPDFDYVQVDIAVTNELAFDKNAAGAGTNIHGSQLRAAPDPKASDYWSKINGNTLEVHRKDLYEVARWAPLMEKAFARYAQQFGQYGGFLPAPNQGNAAGGSGYQGIDGGVAMFALYPIYGQAAEANGANVHRSTTQWTPGGNVMLANAAVVDQLLLLANRGETAAPADTNAPIITAQTFTDEMVNRLGRALPVMIADPDFATLDAERQAAVRQVQTTWTAWNALPPDPPAPAAQPKAAAFRAIGSQCARAVAPGAVDGAANLPKITSKNPGRVDFDLDKDIVPAPSVTALNAFGTALIANTTPATNVNVVGHASSDGAEAHNNDLSQRRAQKVVDAINAAGAITIHTLTPSGVGETGANATADFRRADITVAAVTDSNHLHDAIRSQNIRQAMDLMLDLSNMGTDHSPGQRNIYGGHSYSVLGANFVSSTGIHVPLETVGMAQRAAFYPLVDINVSTIRLRNPHHDNEPDRLGDGTPTHAGDGAPTTGGGKQSDGTFTMSVDEFFRNFQAVDSGVLPKH